jgi:hypothetical protein
MSNPTEFSFPLPNILTSNELIGHFHVLHMPLCWSITQAIKNEKIILGAISNIHMQNFIQSVKGFFIDLSLTSGYRNVLEELLYIVSHLPNNHWKCVAIISMSRSNGGQIEFTSSFTWCLDK